MEGGGGRGGGGGDEENNVLLNHSKQGQQLMEGTKEQVRCRQTNQSYSILYRQNSLPGLCLLGINTTTIRCFSTGTMY